MKEEEQSEQGDGDQHESTPIWVKWYREQEKEGPQKNTKGTKLSLDLITLMDGDLDEIGKKVRDTTIELLQQFEK